MIIGLFARAEDATSHASTNSGHHSPGFSPWRAWLVMALERADALRSGWLVAEHVSQATAPGGCNGTPAAVHYLRSHRMICTRGFLTLHRLPHAEPVSAAERHAGRAGRDAGRIVHAGLREGVLFMPNEISTWVLVLCSILIVGIVAACVPHAARPGSIRTSRCGSCSRISGM
jgi:hypothetical protein